MAYTLAEAAKATGLNKSTIFRAIRKGAISATRDATTKQWAVEPGELHRVYPAIAGNDALEPIAPARNDVADAENRELRARLATTEARLSDAHATIDDLRRRLDSADAERRQATDRLTVLLTDQRPALPPPAPRRWWNWRHQG
jgi:excisionase family DNA binding protein